MSVFCLKRKYRFANNNLYNDPCFLSYLFMKKTLLFATLLLALAGCMTTPEETPIPPKANTTNKLIGKWRIESIVRNTSPVTQDCATDDEWEFNENGQLFIEFGEDCEGRPEGNTGTYPYEVSEDGRFVTVRLFAQDEYNKPREIKELTRNTLKVEYLQDWGASGTYVVTYRKTN